MKASWLIALVLATLTGLPDGAEMDSLLVIEPRP
jgi:hypothetical protein